MDSKITYHQQMSYCGKARCRKCREGVGHGPYWYAYKITNGHTTRTYIGKRLPADVQASLQAITPSQPPFSQGADMSYSPPYIAGAAPADVMARALTDDAALAFDLALLTGSISEVPESASIRILALGQFRLERRSPRSSTWQAVTENAWQQPRVRALLGFLIAHRGRYLSRAQAIELLSVVSAGTGGVSSRRGSRANVGAGSPAAETSINAPAVGAAMLDRTVHALRQLLARSGQETLLRSDDEGIALADQTRIWVDADAFDYALPQIASLRPLFTSAGTDPTTRARERFLKQAAALYGGDFLPEERLAESVLTRRQSLRRGWINLLLELVDTMLLQGSSQSALEVLNRLLANDPVNEPAYQRLMIVLAQLKRRAEALRAYNRLADLLARDQLQPSPETQALFDVVRRGGSLSLADPALSVLRDLSGLAPMASSPSPISSASLPIDTELADAPDQVAGSLPALASVPTVPIDTTTFQIGRSHQSRLIGREAELHALRTMVQEIEQRGRLQVGSQRRASGLPLDTLRRPQCMLLMGEAGLGKTRLAEEASREAQRRGWSVAWGRVHSQESGIPYFLWTDALRKIVNLAPALNSPSRLFPTAADSGLALASALQPLFSILPELAEFLTPVGARHVGRSDAPLSQSLTQPHIQAPFLAAAAPDTRPGDARQEQLRLWEATRDLLISISEGSPLLVVLDDIQWADASSCDLFGYLARHIYGYPIFLLATCRDTELSTQPQHQLRNLVSHMQREHTVNVLNVEPLSPEQIAQLVAYLPETVVQYIQQQAAGNPFFAEELARTAPLPPAELPVLPSTVAAALNSRMGRLSSPCQQLLGHAAVLGGSFEFPLIYAMETAGGHYDEDTVLTLLEEALQSGVLTEEGSGTRITYHFWHPLLVSHLYDNVSARRRASLHLRAADVLTYMYRGREDEVAATITHHLVRADAEPLRTASYAELAADHAYALSAYAESERYYHLALDCLEKSQPMTPDALDPILPTYQRTNAQQEAVQLSTQERLIFLLERLTECMMVRGQYTEARKLYERLLNIYQALEQQERAIGRDASKLRTYAQVQALIWSEIGWTWRYTGNTPKAWECCQRGEDVLNATDVSAGPARAKLLHQRGSLYSLEGHYARARQAVRAALELFEHIQAHKAPSDAPKNGDAAPLFPMGSLSERSSLALAEDAKQGYSVRATRIMRTLEGSAVDLGSSHRLLASIAKSEGHPTEALHHLNIALAIFEQYDHKRRIAHLSVDLGHIYLKLAQNEEAQAAFRRSLSLAERLGDSPLTGVVFYNLAELALASDDLDEAENWYRRALSQAERIHDQEYRSLWSAGLSAVLLQQGRIDEAAHYIWHAFSIGRAMHNNPCIGNALVALANARIKKAQDSTILPRVHQRLLAHARMDLNRALALPGLDAETRTRGELALAQVAILSGDIIPARTQIEHVIAEAHRYELILLEAQARAFLKRLDTG